MRTERYAVIGHGISYSRSPEIHARYQRASDLLDDVLAARSTGSTNGSSSTHATGSPTTFEYDPAIAVTNRAARP